MRFVCGCLICLHCVKENGYDIDVDPCYHKMKLQYGLCGMCDDRMLEKERCVDCRAVNMWLCRKCHIEMEDGLEGSYRLPNMGSVALSRDMKS